VVAVGRSILEVAFISRSTSYQEFGADYFDGQRSERLKRRSLASLGRLGYRVTLTLAAAYLWVFSK